MPWILGSSFWVVFCYLFITFLSMKSGSWRLITAYFISSLNIPFIENKQRAQMRCEAVRVRTKCHNKSENWYLICHFHHWLETEKSTPKFVRVDWALSSKFVHSVHLFDVWILNWGGEKIFWIFSFQFKTFQFSWGRKTVSNLHKWRNWLCYTVAQSYFTIFGEL